MSDAAEQPSSGAELAQALAERTARGQRVVLQGQGSRASLGALIREEHITISTAALDEVLHYEPGDLTITVGAGMPLDTLAELLAGNGQQLPAQNTRRRGTVGGLVAGAADGALALGYGTVRDMIVGAAIAYTDGSLARARGRVVKNVAGYDLPRLMVGSMGTLGALTEVSFKLHPVAPASATLVAGFDNPSDACVAARQLAAQPWEPVFVDLLLGACTAQLAIGFDGRDERVSGLLRACTAWLKSTRCAGQVILEGERDKSLRTRLDDPVAHLAGRLTTPQPTTDDVVLRWWGSPAQVEAMVELLLASRDDGLIVRLDGRPLLGQVFAGLSHDNEATLCATTIGLLAELRRCGSAVLLTAPDTLRRDADTVWGPPPPDFALMSQVKTALDPDRTFAAGRFVGGL